MQLSVKNVMLTVRITVMLTVIWDMKGPVTIDFLGKVITVNVVVPQVTIPLNVCVALQHPLRGYNDTPYAVYYRWILTNTEEHVYIKI